MIHELDEYQRAAGVLLAWAAQSLPKPGKGARAALAPGLYAEARRRLGERLAAQCAAHGLVCPELPLPSGALAGAEAPALAARLAKAAPRAENLLAGLLAKLLGEKGFREGLGPALLRQPKGSASAEALADLSARLPNLADALADPRALKKREAEALAEKLGLEIPQAGHRAPLDAALAAKAQTLAKLRETLADVSAKTRTKAEKALAKLDFPAADAALEAAGAAPEIAEARGYLALLAGRAERGARHFEEAARGFSAADPADGAEERLAYAEALLGHGLRFGPGAAEAARLLRAGLPGLDRERHAPLWAALQGNLGAALVGGAARLSAPARAKALDDAIAACRAAAEVFAETEANQAQAALHAALGQALLDRAEAGGPPGLRAEAERAIRAAIAAYDPAANTLPRALALNALGHALRAQGEAANAASGEAKLAEAARAYLTAEEVLTKRTYPEQWAGVEANLSIVHLLLARRTGAEEAFRTALGHAEAALKVFTPARFPKDHARLARIRDHLKAELAEKPKRRVR